jgi:hypothetical protein
MSAERRPRPSASLRRAPAATRTDAQRILGDEEASLLDVVDNVLNKGVVITGDITIALAQVDLIYARLSLLLCAADRVLPTEDPDPMFRRRARRARRVLANRGV